MDSPSRDIIRGKASAQAGYLFPAAVCLIYFLVSFAVKDRYPFSTFSMFSQTQDSTSRIFAQVKGGKLVHVDTRTSWNCAGELKQRFKQCTSKGEFGYTPYQDKRDESHVLHHLSKATGGEDTRLFRRIWWVSNDGKWHFRDCLISQCRTRSAP